MQKPLVVTSRDLDKLTPARFSPQDYHQAVFALLLVTAALYNCWLLEEVHLALLVWSYLPVSRYTRYVYAIKLRDEVIPSLTCLCNYVLGQMLSNPHRSCFSKAKGMQ
jgi:hypothetical protein